MQLDFRISFNQDASESVAVLVQVHRLPLACMRAGNMDAAASAAVQAQDELLSLSSNFSDEMNEALDYAGVARVPEEETAAESAADKELADDSASYSE